jgi:2-dehydropantoate 2-reductase
MKVCIAGAGAIGGLIGARLARRGHAAVSAWARGATLEALTVRGWAFREADGSAWQVPLAAVGAPAELGVQDLVIIAVKAPALPSMAETIAPLIGPGTRLLSAMNGVPWWWSRSLPRLADAPLASVDPDGRLGQQLPVQAVIGGVVHAAARCPEPGVVQHTRGRGLILGDPLQRPHAEGGVDAVAELLRDAGFDVTVSAHVQTDIWFKLWGNLTMNPISALTGATADRILDDPLVRDLCSAAMHEAADVGHRIGCPIEQTPDDRHAVTRKLGAFKTSMLQDVEAGRPIELDAIVGAVRDIAGRVGVATPAIDALFGLTRLMAQGRGLYPHP